MSVCVRSEHFTDFCFNVDIYASCYGIKKTKRGLMKDAVPNLSSFNKYAVPRMLSERRAKCAEKKHVGGISY